MSLTFDPNSAAVFTDKRRRRIWLRRKLGMFGSTIAFLCYNPSIAAAEVNDPSVKRMIGFAIANDAAELIVVNAFTIISPDPDDLAAFKDPVGPDANDAIRLAHKLATDSGGIMIAGWGAPKGKQATRELAVVRFAAIRSMGLELHYLRMTAGGYPEHPLYLPATLKPQLWRNCRVNQTDGSRGAL